ncbi:MAG: glycosyltransferase [Oligoflexia bacterium]|nr:glycosyltransferase [Oligoflexia bacterium]
MRIAILGTRGIPARYGGFETFAEELSVRLARRGHQVTVYARRRFGRAQPQQDYQGVAVRYVPTLMHKYLETPLHALFSFFDLITHRVDVVLLCNAANSPMAWLARLLRIPLCINVDGIERNRAKWNWLGRAWYRLGEFCSVLFADRVIADAEVIRDYYRETYRIDSTVIAYGARVHKREAGTTLAQFKLEAKRYLLYVSRLEPENNALGVIQAYRASGCNLPLVIVGDAPYAEEYKRALYAAASPGVVFTGYQFGAAYEELQSNCYLYIQATEVGGTHPALVEAMGYGNCVVANRTPEHEEVLADCGIYYEKNYFEELAAILRRLVNDQNLVLGLGVKARARAAERFSWDAVTDQYERLLLELVQGPNPVKAIS